MKAKAAEARPKQDLRRVAAIAGGGVVAVVAIVSMMGSGTSSAPASTKTETARKVSARPEKAAAPVAKAPAATRRNVFQPLVTPERKRNGASRLALGQRNAQTLGADLLLPAVPSAADGAQSANGQQSALNRKGPEYVGTVTVNGAMLALVQDPRTGEGVYLRKGDYYNTAKVTQVTRDLIELVTDRGPVVLMKTSGTEPPKPRTTPQRAAPNNPNNLVANQGQQQGQAQAAAQPQPPMPGPMPGFNAGAMMERFRQMSPEERRNQIEAFRNQLSPEQRQELGRFFRGGNGGRRRG